MSLNTHQIQWLNFESSGVEGDMKSIPSVTTPTTKESTPFNTQDHQLDAFINPSSLMLPSPSCLFPESHGTWSIFQSQAGDLHTPAAKLDQATPFSFAPAISGGETNNQSMPMVLDQFNQQYFWENTQHMNATTQQMNTVNPLSSVNGMYETWDSSVPRSSTVDHFQPEKSILSTESPKSPENNEDKKYVDEILTSARSIP